MMKLVCLVVLIVVTVEQSYAGPEMDKIIADCKTSEKLTDADVTNFKNKVKPSTKEVKCLTTCVLEKMGLITNNQLNVEGGLKIAKTVPNSNEKTVQSYTEVMDECKAVQDPERCEFGDKLMSCLMEAGAKRQLTCFM